MIGSLVLLFGGWAHAACTFDATPERLREALEAAEAAYVTLDVSEFERAMAEVDFVVPCLEATVDPADAARLHRMRGLGRYAAGDVPGAEAALRAAKRLEPAYTFSEAVLPPGFELRTLYEGLGVEPGEQRRLPRPGKDTSLWFDGSDARDRALDVPVLWQVQTATDGLRTEYLEPTAPMPWYPGANKDQLPWLVGAGVTAAGSGVMLGLARYNHQLVTNPAELGRFADQDALLAQQRRTNVYGAACAVLGTAAATELVVALVKGGRN